ncbi:hypothetical protein CDV31_006921 [Fusarium ambrosium]|uniref:Uncharacterized protein n=1 Tax=Fusarium ambrosium TaxID=131363 RepID=A0A428UA05_9HYPO|nr:hypothetical protein CDV31_006921 [Fusarium ambrosium]
MSPKSVSTERDHQSPHILLILELLPVQSVEWKKREPRSSNYQIDRGPENPCPVFSRCIRTLQHLPTPTCRQGRSSS